MHTTDVQEQVLLNDFRRQWADVGGAVLAATQRVGESGWYILGKEVQGFEQSLASFTQRAHAVGCGNGMDALEIALRALGLKPGDRVLTTALSAFATTLAIVRAGGVPVFVDVDRFGLLHLDRVRTALQKNRGIRFLLPVHLYGHAIDLGQLAGIKNEFAIEIVEDCCQAVGAGWGEASVGSVGAASALSFYPTKNLGAMGDGGAVLTDDPRLEASSRALRDYGQASRYHHDTLGLNSRLDELHAAILRTAFLPRLVGWTARRAEIARAYIAGIAHPKVVVPGAPPGSCSVWHLFPVLVEPQLREDFRAHLDRARVSSAIHYPISIPRQAALQAVPFEALDALEETSHYCDSEVSLPIHPYMTDAEVGRVISAVNSWRIS